jgi:putative membrane protein
MGQHKLTSGPASRGGGPASIACVLDEVETADATRRTRLANERTYLAWWRTALAAFAVGVGFAGLPHVTHVTRWPFVVAGVLFALLGLSFVVIGALRQHAVESALDQGEFARLDPRVVAALAAAGVVLGIVSASA